MPNGRKFKGNKHAFSANELKEAFIKLGYTKVRIEPILINFKMKPPFETVLQFVNLSSFMLLEEMPYDKILELLSEEETNITMKTSLKTIQSELKKGREGEEVFKEHERTFGKFPAYMLGLATKSGNMAEVYQATAKFLERDQEYRTNIRDAFMIPGFTVLVMLGAVVYYLGWVFPSTASMFERFNMPVPPMTAATIEFSDFIQDHWLVITSIILLPVISLAMWFTTQKGAFYRDKLIVKIPMVGPLLHKISIEIFFRVFSAIYSGAENNIETLRASAESCRNKWIEHGIKEVAIPMMLRDGASLVPALAKAQVFNRNCLNRLRTGSETGNVLAVAGQIARFYEQETGFKMRRLIAHINNLIGIFIAVILLALTIISSEVALFSAPGGGAGAGIF